MFIWLKKGAEENLVALKEQEILWDVKVETDRGTGKRYIHVYEDVFDPATEIPDIPTDLIERVTLKDVIYRGLRTEGVYHCGVGTVMVVKTEVKIHSEMMADTIEREEFQRISISAPSVEALKSIYTLVRQGKLAPEENWEGNTPIASPAHAPADETEEVTA